MMGMFITALSFEALLIFLAMIIGYVLGTLKEKNEEPGVTHTENTLFTVFHELRAAGMTDNEAQDTIMRMQNEGILFREVAKS
jgi:hypothetical protein